MSGWGYCTNPGNGLLLNWFITENNNNTYYHSYAYQLFFAESVVSGNDTIKIRHRSSDTWTTWHSITIQN